MVDQQTYNFNRDLLNSEKHARLMNVLLITQLDCRVLSIRWIFLHVPAITPDLSSVVLRDYGDLSL